MDLTLHYLNGTTEIKIPVTIKCFLPEVVIYKMSSIKSYCQISKKKRYTIAEEIYGKFCLFSAIYEISGIRICQKADMRSN